MKTFDGVEVGLSMDAARGALYPNPLKPGTYICHPDTWEQILASKTFVMAERAPSTPVRLRNLAYFQTHTSHEYYGIKRKTVDELFPLSIADNVVPLK